jgi:hypothetical protein
MILGYYRIREFEAALVFVVVLTSTSGSVSQKSLAPNAHPSTTSSAIRHLRDSVSMSALGARDDQRQAAPSTVRTAQLTEPSGRGRVELLLTTCYITPSGLSLGSQQPQ